MSATERDQAREPDDQYFTRYPCALAICERLEADGVFGEVRGRPMTLLEPSCGRGGFVHAMRDTWGIKRGARIDVCDLAPELLPRRLRLKVAHVRKGDFLSWRAPAGSYETGYDGILGNPPYDQAEAHVRHAIAWLKTLTESPDAAVAFLMRLNFLEGIGRGAGLWREHPPEFVYALDKRPPFKRNNKTDATAYGVFVWRKVSVADEPRIRFLQWGHYMKRWRLSVYKESA